MNPNQRELASWVWMVVAVVVASAGCASEPIETAGTESAVRDVEASYEPSTSTLHLEGEVQPSSDFEASFGASNVYVEVDALVAPPSKLLLGDFRVAGAGSSGEAFDFDVRLDAEGNVVSFEVDGVVAGAPATSANVQPILAALGEELASSHPAQLLGAVVGHSDAGASPSVGGASEALTWSCFWDGVKAIGSLLAFAGASIAAVTGCAGISVASAGAAVVACVGALLRQWGAGVAHVALVATWICDCVNPAADFCDPKPSAIAVASGTGGHGFQKLKD